MKRLYKVKNIMTGAFAHKTETVMVQKGKKRQAKQRVGAVRYFGNKKEAKALRNELNGDGDLGWRVAIAEDHRNFMG